MAEQSQAQGAIKKLKHEITCSICLEDLADPKRLPCGHVYCKVPCLQGVLQISKNSTVTCPKCRRVAQVPDNDLDNLPTAFQVNQLKEIHSELSKGAVGHNISHPCTQQATDTLAKIEKVKGKVVSHKEALTHEITESFDALHRVLEEQKQALLVELQTATDEKLATINTQQQAIETASADLLESVGKHDELLVKYRQLEHTIEEVTDTLSQDSLNPEDLVVRVSHPSELESICASTNYVKMGIPDLQRCSARGDGMISAEIDTPTMFTVHIANDDGIPCCGRVSVELKTLRDGAITHPQVTTCSPSHYKVSYTPTVRGRHEMSIKVNGEDIADSPFKVFVWIPVSKIKEPVAEITDLVGPTGLHSDAERILICDHKGNQVVMYDHSFRRVAAVKDESRFQAFYAKKLKGPMAVTTDKQSNIYITTVENNSLHKFTKDGIHVKTVTGTGRKGGQFRFPSGMCTFEDQFLYVCDSNNRRVLAFGLDLNFKSEITENFSWPSGVDLDNSGNLYISQNDGSCIKVVSPSDEELHTIREHLSKPESVKIFRGVLYVTDFTKNCIHSFTLSGEYKGSFGHEHIESPEGLAIDEDGYVYVSNQQKSVLVL